MKDGTSLVVLLAFSVVQTSQGQGTIIANTFGPGNTFNPNFGFIAGWNTFSTYGNGVATPFSVSGGNYYLDSVTLALGHQQGANTMNISLVKDNGGAPLGPLVETVTSDLAPVAGLYQVVTFGSALNPVLANGEIFWLVVEPPAQNLANNDDNSVYQWYGSEMIGAAGVRSFDFGAGNWLSWQVFNGGYVPAFSIEGTAVPEPGTFSLLLVGAGFVGFRGWRKSIFKC